MKLTTDSETVVSRVNLSLGPKEAAQLYQVLREVLGTEAKPYSFASYAKGEYGDGGYDVTIRSIVEGIANSGVKLWRDVIHGDEDR